MKIALVARGVYPFDFGGREIRVRQLAKHFTLKGHEVTVFIPQTRGVNYDKGFEGFEISPVQIFPDSPRLLNSLGAISFARRISRLLSGESFDVVDMLFYSFPFDSDAKIIATLNVVLPAWRHVSLVKKTYTLPVVLIRAMLNFGKAQFANRVICVSEGSREEVRGFYKLQEEKITVIKNGVDAELFNPEARSDVRENYGIDDDTFLILYAGRLVEAKGVQDLIQAFRRICMDLDAKLMIVGEGNYKVHLKKLAPKGDVIFVETQPYEEMPRFYRAADLFVLPSYWEVQPLGCVEAMACGTPVVAANVGGVPEIINSGENGLLFQPGDDEGLKNAILKIAANTELEEGLIEKGLEFAEKRTWKRIARKTLEVYNEKGP